MLNRRNLRRGREAVTPIYDMRDAERTLGLFRGQGYGQWFDVLPGLRARFWNAGHLLGSASVEIEVAGLRLLFSGDIGPDTKLLQPDPTGPVGVDYLICETTYGDVDRIEASAERRRAVLRAEVEGAMRRGGALLIPSFAVERAQELISDLTALMMAGDLPFTPIHVDSPLATRATAIFRKHAADLENGAQLVDGITSRHVHFTETVEQSRALAQVRGFHIIIAASGMCDAGRIRHHLKNWIAQGSATLLLVGYQAAGTLGRILQDGAPMVRIQGEEFPVQAAVRSIDLYSGHADGPELRQWVMERLPVAHGLFLVHGEEEAMAGMLGRMAGVVSAEKLVQPALDEVFELGREGFTRLASADPPRLGPEQVARLDWHNDVSRLILDINAALREVPDEKGRAVLVRRLRRALEESGHMPPPRKPARRRQ
jgi:metallo-beta-lactamase family protein